MNPAIIPSLPPALQVSGLTAIGGMVLAGGGFTPQTPAQWLAALAMTASAVNIGGRKTWIYRQDVCNDRE